MDYNIKLVTRIRKYLDNFPGLKMEEKKMFGGLAFMVDGEMCVNVSGDTLMCRYDPDLQQEVTGKDSYQPMIMKGREYKGYCYISPESFEAKKDFEYWVNLCLDFNEKATSSKK